VVKVVVCFVAVVYDEDFLRSFVVTVGATVVGTLVSNPNETNSEQDYDEE